MKKNLIMAAAAALALGALADVFALKPGLSANSAAVGKLVFADAISTNASATVAIKGIKTVYSYTNAFKNVTTPHEVYTFTYTNYDGNAAITTNVWDSFSYADWTTNGVSKIIGNVAVSTTNTTETVPDGRRVAATFAKTNDLASISVSGHYGSTAPESAVYVTGGQYLVTGASDDDSVTIILEK